MDKREFNMDGILYTIAFDGYSLHGEKKGSLWIVGYQQDRKVLTLPEEINGRIVYGIGRYAFQRDPLLERVILPPSIGVLGYDSFFYCPSLKYIYLPKSVQTIEVTRLGDTPFRGCSALERIEVEKENSLLKSEGNCLLSKGGKKLIAGCKNSILPSSVKSIERGAFSEITSLKKILIPEGVETISRSVFYDCVSLNHVELPRSLHYIGEASFAFTYSLKEITYRGRKEEWDKIEKENQWNIGSALSTIHCSDGTFLLKAEVSPVIVS